MLSPSINTGTTGPTFWTGDLPAGATIQQVWFAGAHSNVGGGYNTRTRADIPLVWIAKQAEGVGLVLDWTCLPDPTMLKPTAPSHDPFLGLFALDRYHPTIRDIGMKKCPVKFNESLYCTLDENGKPTTTINESVHRSVLPRHSGSAQICSDDAKGVGGLGPYKPENLVPLFNGGTFTGLPIVE
ncbi:MULTISPECIES: phospholipase effector Tle1 domain-containing protein [unclassified Bradyrhizobium]|uniref:phospholipase effector Tle1 domain-containing protein n=1 Tax=unclassified Bradyrhizobium TaxID=2631580 RepID=UPI001BA5A113|nr:MULTISPECIES: DUF2235 domain-containing protein [unclassified Bradyrhizobium]MBR1201838.1 DUF2235 domain-containing protein [Bradyrhizobium sp. AUGA SZCCT0124]MBR1311593.1 DUF2235 domain-containing protein [Bradyrhizobium sp. AUGA SZCCT0051]MBR1338787.1 DUF2235 domain-containing protein [Bradyrhizobium sp. AUGA SZCCT0105]MBR1353361.1 DUF2235 domain-containing protein [Bradyrhizobium sp. AUGA SZCCT0045]